MRGKLTEREAQRFGLLCGKRVWVKSEVVARIRERLTMMVISGIRVTHRKPVRVRLGIVELAAVLC